MKLIAEWQLLLSKPSAARAATIALGVIWAIAAMWGWFFVEPTVLRDSQAARSFVDFATGVFPWLNNIKKLGADAEKGLFLHSVYFFALAPGALLCTYISISRPRVEKLVVNDSPFQMLTEVFFCFAFACLLIWGMYSYILQPSFGKLHRTGYSFVISQFMAPVVAPFFIMGFWCAIASGLYCAYFSVRKLIFR